MTYDRNTPEGEAMHTLEVAPEVIHHDVVRPPANLTDHRWKQRGFTIHCDGASTHGGHGFHVNHDQHLTGISPEGYPVIDNVVMRDAQNIEGDDLEPLA